jgi:hypothetical protein
VTLAHWSFESTTKCCTRLAKSYSKSLFFRQAQIAKDALLVLADVMENPKDFNICPQCILTVLEAISDVGCIVDYHRECHSYPFRAMTSVQSEPQGIEVSPSSDQSKEQQVVNVSFADEDEEPVTIVKHSIDYMLVDKTPNAEIARYLTRPALIYEKQWTEGTYLDPSTDFVLPWHAYFNRNSLQAKLNHYYLLKCNLRLKIVINASPFYYGCALGYYAPLQNFDACPVATRPTGSNEDMVAFSQRPHIYLYPQENQGGEMLLPFFTPQNWLDATSASALQNFGILEFKSFYPLLNANSVAGGSVTISVYAWAEDIQLSAPTMNLSVQSEPQSMKKKGKKSGKGMNAKKLCDQRDEYDYEGVISKPASAIARAAGYLTGLPEVGAFATATSFAAGAIADIAKAYGYTNVPVVEDVHAYRPSPFPQFASTEIGTPIEKLTLDSKNELTVDPKVTGANTGDELQIASIIQREAYVYQFDWTSASSSNANLMGCKVNPMFQLNSYAGTNQTIVQDGPLAYVGRCFSYWRGDIIYRFKFLCTQYHKGRVKISFDPRFNITTLAQDYSTETYTRVVDISEETDVEIRVPYCQPWAYLKCSGTNTSMGFGTTIGTTGLDNSNGYLTVKVLNRQTSPVSSADIKVLVFMRAADNFEYACPAKIDRQFSPYTVQSSPQDYDDLNTEEKPLSGAVVETDPRINLVYHGETVSSVRQLLHRFSKYIRVSLSQTNVANTAYYTHTVKLPRNNLFPGFDPDGLDVVTGITSAVNENYNYMNWNYMNWFQQAFIGRTGSIRYAINPSTKATDNEKSSLLICRTRDTRSIADYVIVSSETNHAFAPVFSRADHCSGTEALSVTNHQTLPGPTVEVPMYSRFKFQANIATSNAFGLSDDDTEFDTIEIDMTSVKNTTATRYQFLDLYTSAGTDFNLVFFLNVPTMYHYNSSPTWVDQN